MSSSQIHEVSSSERNERRFEGGLLEASLVIAVIPFLLEASLKVPSCLKSCAPQRNTRESFVLQVPRHKSRRCSGPGRSMVPRVVHPDGRWYFRIS